jgi:hypothetical protein
MRVLPGDAAAWLHPAAVRQMRAYIRDLYLHGLYGRARHELEGLLASLDAYPWPQAFADDFAQARSECETYIGRLNNNLDYFGNPGGWVPTLSFETSLKLFRDEVRSAMSLLYLTRWINKTRDAVENRKVGLREFAETAAADMVGHMHAYNALNDENRELGRLAGELARDIPVLLAQMEAAEQRLLRRAKDIVEERKSKSFFAKFTEIVGTIMTVLPIPGAQPALAAAGQAVRLIGQASTGQKNWEETVVAAANIWTQYEENKFKAEVAELNKVRKGLEEKNEVHAKALAEDRESREERERRREREEEWKREEDALDAADGKLREERREFEEKLDKMTAAGDANIEQYKASVEAGLGRKEGRVEHDRKILEAKKAVEMNERKIADIDNAIAAMGKKAENGWKQSSRYLKDAVLLMEGRAAGVDDEIEYASSETVAGMQRALQEYNSLGRRLAGIGVPEGDVNAELNRLKAADPAFLEVTRTLEDIRERKKALAERIAVNGGAAGQRLNDIAAAYRAIDQAYNSLYDVHRLYSMELAQSVNDMEQRAMDRLIRYQYILAKAYEHRMLEPYGFSRDGKIAVNPFKLDRLFRQIETMLDGAASAGVDLDKPWELTPENYRALEAVYDQNCREIVHGVVDAMSRSPLRMRNNLTFRVHPEYLRRLQSQRHAAIIDLGMHGPFRKDEQGIRIHDIGVHEIRLKCRGTPPSGSRLDVEMTHGGTSLIDRDGKSYYFRYAQGDKNQISVWKSTVYLGGEAPIGENRPRRQYIGFNRNAPSDMSLLTAIMNQERTPEWDLFVTPGGNCILTLSLIPSGSMGDFEYEIESLQLFVDYEYSDRGDARLQNMVWIEAEGEGEIAELPVPIEVGTRDGSVLGVGYFSAKANYGQSVTISAPETHGDWKFARWETPSGRRVGNILRVEELGSHQIFRAVYGRAFIEPAEAEASADGAARDGRRLDREMTITRFGRE